MTIGEYIEILQEQDPSMQLEVGLGNPHSWRGSYDEVAFEPVTNVSVGWMLEEARKATKRVYTGWKGGEYKYNEHTTINIDCQGNWSDNTELFKMLFKFMFNQQNIHLENE